MPTPSPRLATAVAAVLLVLGGLAGIVWALLPEADVPQAASAALLAAGGVGLTLTGTRIASRPRLRVPIAGVLVALAAERVLAAAGEHAEVAAAGTCAVVLGWATLALGPGAAMRLSPAITVGHAAAIAAAGDSIALVAVSPAAALLFELVAFPLHALRAARLDRRRALRGIDVLAVGSDDLRATDVQDVGDRVARLAAELTRARGALVYVSAAGEVNITGRFGAYPEPRRGAAVAEAALRGAPVAAGDTLLVPIEGEAGVVGVVALHGARRRVDEVLSGLLALFGHAAGASLDRVARAAGGCAIADIDPVTGVGSRRQASTAVAALRPGDGLVLLGVDDVRQIRGAQGEQAADLLLGQMGLHLRNSTRPGDAVARYGDDQFVIVLREPKAPVDSVVHRIADSWLQLRPGRTITVGAALHLAGDAPLDTLERTQSALAAPYRAPVRTSA